MGRIYCQDSRGDTLITCDFCEHVFDPDDIGLIRITEMAPYDHDYETEGYNFCQYKCLRLWVGL